MDEADLKILEILNENSRIPYEDIGKRINLTGNAIRTRVVKMIKEGVIESFVFKVHPDIFGIKTCYAVFECGKDLELSEKLNKKLGDDPRYGEIITSLDGTLIVRVYGIGQEELNVAVEDLKKKMKNYKLSIIIQRYTLPLDQPKLNSPLLRVMGALIEDVRIPVSKLAEKCHMTSKSAKWYLSQIKNQNLGRFSINTQPYKITNRIFVNIFISKKIDYINFASLFNLLKTDLKKVIFHDYLLVNPSGLYLEVTAESIGEIDEIERKVLNFLKDQYYYKKMFPSKIIYRPNLIEKILRDKVRKINTFSG
ncbi:MAG: AsnC family transcriptional regulator [Promethearchaeota archaeon]